MTAPPHWRFSSEVRKHIVNTGRATVRVGARGYPGFSRRDRLRACGSVLFSFWEVFRLSSRLGFRIHATTCCKLVLVAWWRDILAVLFPSGRAAPSKQF